MIFVSQIVLWWDLPQKIILGSYLQYSQNKAQIVEKNPNCTKIQTTLEPLPILNFFISEFSIEFGANWREMSVKCAFQNPRKKF